MGIYMLVTSGTRNYSTTFTLGLVPTAIQGKQGQVACGPKPKGGNKMELYTNTNWTGCYDNVYIAEAIAWSENGNHATISTTGSTAQEADAKLVGALRELNLLSNTTIEGAR